jgi:hypothetical protein
MLDALMPKALKRFARKNPFLYVLYNVTRLIKGYYPIFLDYPLNPVPRYGYGKPPHPQLNALFAKGDAHYRELLTSFLHFEAELLKIPRSTEKGSSSPSWINKWLDGLDTLALYGFVASGSAKTYLEVGSGYSTKVVRQAIKDRNLPTRLVSIDPQPRAEIDAICDEVLRQPLETVDLSVFDRLAAGDILFVDNSHRSFMNSDVTVFFLDILPRLQRGVLVHIHDIYLPYDYMPERAEWYYSEQYLLASSLLAGHQNYEVLLPVHYIEHAPTVRSATDSLWKHPHMQGVTQMGCSFWLRTR